MKRHRKLYGQLLSRWGRSLLFLSPLVLASCQLAIEAPKLDGEERAKLYIQAVARGQEAYYKANGNFASSFEKLAMNFNLETKDYRYSLVSEGEKAQRVVMTAAAKVDGLPSYAGIMLVNPSSESLEATINACQTTEPSRTPPVFPSQLAPGRELDCPPGSEPMQ